MGLCQRQKVPELRTEAELELCEWFADNPLFYDQSEVHFKNKQKKDRMLTEKGKEYNLIGKYYFKRFPTYPTKRNAPVRFSHYVVFLM